MKNLILAVLVLLFTTSVCKTQQIKFPDSFILGKQDFLKNQVFIPIKMLLKNGFNIKKNPAVTEDKEIISLFAENFNLEDISRAYFELYTNKINDESMSITVLEFKTGDKLKDNLKTVDEIGLFIPFYFVVDNYVIIIRSDDRPLINEMSNFYSKKIGAKYYLPNRHRP